MAIESRLVVVVIVIMMVTTALFVGLDVVRSVDDKTSETETREHTSVLLDGAGAWVTVDDGDADGTDETVLKSRGRGLNFTGASDSYVATSGTVDLTATNNWTVTQGVISIQDTSNQQIILAIGDPDLYLEYHGSTGNYSAVWTGGVGSTRVNVSEGTRPSVIYVNRSGDNLTIWRNATKGDSATISTSDSAGGDLTAAENFDGVLDETRVFNDSLTATQRQSIRDNPNDPLTSAERELRIMYDDSHRSDRTVQVFHAGGDATRSNTSYVDGWERETVSSGSLTGNGDYNWRSDGPQLRPNPNGELDGAPVAYVDYDRRKAGHSVEEGFTEAWNLAALIPTILMLVLIVTILVKARGVV